MASTRLTNSIRESICRGLLERKFLGSLKDIIMQRRSLVHRLYEHLYSLKVRTDMEKLPAGWLLEVDGITVQFNGHQRGYMRLYFDGRLDYAHFDTLRSLWNRCGSRDEKSTNRRLQHRHSDGCALVLDSDHPLWREHAKIFQALEDLTVEYNHTRRAIDAMLRSTTTIEALIKTWPEVDKFARPYIRPAEGQASKALAPRIEELNSLLDLPPEEEAA